MEGTAGAVTGAVTGAAAGASLLPPPKEPAIAPTARWAIALPVPNAIPWAIVEPIPESIPPPLLCCCIGAGAWDTGAGAGGGGDGRGGGAAMVELDLAGGDDFLGEGALDLPKNTVSRSIPTISAKSITIHTFPC